MTKYLRLFVIALFGLTVGYQEAFSAEPLPPPNILWLSSEDHGPHLGCYGDRFATTPNVDQLAAKGVRYAHVWSCAPVCAPARTTIISGMYPPSTGSEHMRSLVPYPAGLKMFPQLLREAGYYCTNNAKEDYNLAKPGQVWDVSSPKAHWQNAPAGKPFFAVFNSEKSHESKIRTRPHQPIHDPAQVRIPAYHPDTPEVRQDWAQYYDQVSEADAEAGARLRELEQAGLADSTIVLYWADHGSGMPRNKRTPCDSGLHVPLIVHIPAKYKHLAPEDYVPGGVSERLVSFVDFAPTVLSLAGIHPPEWMQGQAFLGKYATEPQPYIYGFRGRMDERPDLVRSVSDGRFVYLRNYMPQLPHGQHVEYMFQTPTTRVWKALFDTGKLTSEQSHYWQPRSPEELYDLKADPDEVHNLAAAPEHQETLQRFRQAQQNWARKIRDVGFLPEGELFSRALGVSPYDLGHDLKRYPLEKILETAEIASRLNAEDSSTLRQALHDADSAVRYWAALGMLMRGPNAFAQFHDDLLQGLKDEATAVRIVAAQALVQFGSEQEQTAALAVLVDLADGKKHGVFTAVAALTALDVVGEKARSVLPQLQALPTTAELPDQRYSPYIPRLLGDLREKFR